VKATIRLGRVAGVPIGAHWSVLLVTMLLADLMAMVLLPARVGGYPPGVYWAAGAATAVLFLVSLLAHELAHAMVARHFGVGVEGITLWLLGGATQFTGEVSTARAELLISGAGPVASGVVAGLWEGAAVGAAALGAPGPVTVALGWLALVNLVLAVFNLLPGSPLDGGRVLRAILWRATGDRAGATAKAAKAGQALGAALLGVGVFLLLMGYLVDGLWTAVVGWFLATSATAEGQRETVRTALGEVRVGQAMSGPGQTAPGWYTAAAFLEHAGWNLHQRVFPVLDFQGAPVGVISLAELAAVPEQQRFTRRISDLARPLSRLVVARPEQPVLDVLTAGLRPGRDLVLVVEGARLVGTISADDLARVVELGTVLGGHGTSGPIPVQGATRIP
jgi:Zn-dependent protease